MSDSTKTIAGFIEALEILASGLSEGMQTEYFLESTYDVIICDADIGPDTIKGQRLRQLGWHYPGDYDAWEYFT